MLANESNKELKVIGGAKLVKCWQIRTTKNLRLLVVQGWE